MSEGHALPQTPTPEGFQPHKVWHHFRSAEEEFQSVKLGFWLFLVTEVMLFGGLFAGYILYHDLYLETWVECGKLLNWKLGALNTVVLLTSSWSMAMGVRACQRSKKAEMIRWLWLTILCAGMFMVVKYFEYSAKFAHGVFPGSYFTPDETYLPKFLGLEYPNLFWSFYFTMTGIHGFHVLIGMLLIGWLIWAGGKGRFHAGFTAPVDLIGLYWHIVDLIWIFLFPLLYLVP